jgi:ferredoxin
MVSVLVIFNMGKRDSIADSLVRFIADSNMADRTLLIEDPAHLGDVRADSAIICHFEKTMAVMQAKEKLEGNGTHPLAIELVDLNIFLKISTVDVNRCTIAALRAIMKKLRGSMTAKATESLVPTHGTSFSKRDLVKYLSKGFKTYRHIPMVEEPCMAKHGCVSCMNACPYSAIRIDGEHVQVLQSNCVECGLCAVSCPEYYIQVPTFLEQVQQVMVSSLADSLKGTDATVLFTCRYGFRMLEGNVRDHRGRDFVPVEIPCVAAFSHLALMKARQKGLRIKLICPEKTCKARESAEEYTSLTSGIIPNVNEISITDGLDIDAIDTSHNHEPQIIDFGGNKRQVLSKFLSDKDRETFRYRKLSFFNAIVDQNKCNMCGACAKACIPEALKVVNMDGKDVLQFEHSKCIACMGCEKACWPDAIKIVREVDFKSLNSTVTLMVDRSKCVVCGKTIERAPASTEENAAMGLEPVDEYCDDCKKSLLPGREV